MADKDTPVITDENLQIALKKVEGVQNGLSITLSGYIDTYNSTFFQQSVCKAIEGGCVNLIFDCSALSNVSSTGIGAFISFLKLVKNRDGDIVLFALKPEVLETFRLLGFARFFNIRNTAEEAAAYFSTAQKVYVFPKIFFCPVCRKKLKSDCSGRFRCVECKSILAIDAQGHVSLGW